MSEATSRLRCACGWEATGTLDELVVEATEHGRRIHNMTPTREQVLAMVVDDEEPAAGGGSSGKADPISP
jgi:predicted small metal-binding protein